ncbi:MAG: YncE family protein [Chloroflexota bacterium]|nr:YncE family protein [Chloroflexota bacterium]
MKRKHTTIVRASMTGLISLAIILSAFPLAPRAAAASCTLDPTNLTTNGSMPGPGHSAPPYGIVVNGWTPFILGSTLPNFEWVNNENAPGDVAGTGAQYIWLDTYAFDAGIYQTITGLTPGTYYRFWLGYALAAYDPGIGQNLRNNLIGRQVGYDLTGGTNASAPSVTWGNVYWNGIAALNIPDLSLTFVAQTTRVTIFLRVVNTNVNNGRSKVWFDVVCVEPLNPQPPPTGPSTVFLPMARYDPSACTPLTLAATIPVGTHPKGVAADPATNRVFVGLFDDSSVAVVNAATNQKIAAWSTNSTGHSNGVGVTAGELFVAMRDAAIVSILDGGTGAFVVSQSVGTLPYGVGASGGTVWVANFGSDSVSAINAATNVVTTTSTGNSPALVAAAGSRAFVSLWGGGVAQVASDGTLLSTFSATGAGSFGVTFNAASNRLYVSNRTSAQIFVLDGTSGSVVNSVTLAQIPYALAFSPSTNHLFAVLADSNLLDVRDGTTLDRIAVIALDAQGAQGGDGIAVMNGRVYVANNAAGTLSVIRDSCP